MKPKLLFERLTSRVKRLTLIEVLLILLFFCCYGVYDRLGDASEHMQHTEDNIVDLQNKVSGESNDVQTKLDEQKDVLERIEANQP
jgi:hypothetical protein